jgi:hypothetical protein
MEVFNRRNGVKVQFTFEERSVLIPKGTRVRNSEGWEYRTRRKASFGLWRQLLWRLSCWWSGRRKPRRITIPVERVG